MSVRQAETPSIEMVQSGFVVCRCCEYLLASVRTSLKLATTNVGMPAFSEQRHAGPCESLKAKRGATCKAGDHSFGTACPMDDRQAINYM